MTTKKDDTQQQEEATIDVGGFTPEEEAALDAAARGNETAAVEAKPDEATATVKPEDEIARLQKALTDANATISKNATERADQERGRANRVDEREAEEVARIKIADDKAAAELELATRDVNDLNRQLREAIENGDVDKQMAVNTKLIKAMLKVGKTEDGIASYEKWKESRKDFWDAERKKAGKPVRQTTPNDLIEFHAEDYTPKALAWIEKHPEFKNDLEFQKKAIRAHHSAVGEDIVEDSDDYFNFLDKKLGFSTDEADAAAEADAQADAAKVVVTTPPAKKPAAKVQMQLPPSRTGTGQVRQEGNRVKKLTPQEVEAAEISGMTPEEYWDDKYGNRQ